jgi:tetratricopeptide (TPR) repeat protein
LPPFERDDVLRPEVTAYFLGRLESSMGDASPAMKDALDAARKGRFDALLDGLAASPDDAAARVLWGLALLTRGDLENAGAEFRAALAIDSELSPGQFYLGAWHAAMGNDAEAVRVWQGVVATEFDQPAVFEALIDALLRVGQVGRAGALVEEARSQWKDGRMTPRAAAVAIASGDVRGAMETLAPYLEKRPGDVRTLALAMRAIAHTHVNGGTVFDAAADKERVTRYAQLYEKAGGPDKASVAGWVAAVK